MGNLNHFAYSIYPGVTEFNIISQYWDPKDSGRTMGCDPEDAKDFGFAVQGNETHLPIDIPDGETVITCRTRNGKLVTFKFSPDKNGPQTKTPSRVEIVSHSYDYRTENGEPVQDAALMHGDEFLAMGTKFNKKPCTKVVVML